MKETKHIRRDLYSVAWVMPQGWDLGALGVPRGTKKFKHGQVPGRYSLFFCIRRLGPSIYPSPQKNIRSFKHPKKIFEILANQKNIPILYNDLKKRP